MNDYALDRTTLHHLYRTGALSPAQLVDDILERMAQINHPNIWISTLDRDRLQGYAEQLGPMEGKPLYGLPFAIKDNIDLAELPTTAGCPDYSHQPQRHAFVVQKLIDAGAIPIGKTNLDQFATGLVGIRTPYGTCGNAFDPTFIPGGSSSGSAVALAKGLVTFSLGTDTAGSGRIPAALNNILGIKPTRGLLSNSGVVPACRSLDCVSIFCLTAADGAAILDVAASFDPEDPYTRPNRPGTSLPSAFRFGTLSDDQLETFGDTECEGLYRRAIESLKDAGGQAVEIDFAPFQQAASLLYEGPWIAERFVAIETFLKEKPDAIHPVTRGIIEGGANPSAADAFKAAYRLQTLRRASEPVWNEVDFIITPTAATAYTIQEVEASPVQLNTNLGYYMNFMNLLDLSAIAVPAGFKTNGQPLGVTLFAPAFDDGKLLQAAQPLHQRSVETLGATAHPLPDLSPTIPTGGMKIAVCGAHLSGQPLNHQLADPGGHLVARTKTAPVYKMVALPSDPPKPGLVRVETGAAIEVEIWELPKEAAATFIDGIPCPLGIGRIQLEDGSDVAGFLCEPLAVEGAEDISKYGSWRAYLGPNSDQDRFGGHPRKTH